MSKIGLKRAKIKDLPENERPRERLERYGTNYLSDAELIAILIRTGTKEASALDIAKALLSETKGLAKLFSMDFKELSSIKGIGKSKASAILAAVELGRRGVREIGEGKIKIKGPEDVYSYLLPEFKGVKKEKFGILILDTKNHIKSEKIISEGDIQTSIVHPREIFYHAILELAASIILFHNHPSGDPTPSAHDREITMKAVSTGKMIGIGVLDHVIIGDGLYYSFKEKGEI
ncbi:MAG: RadC family protein [Candidatus Aminicenantia bacterium]